MTTRIFKIKLADADCERLYAIASKRRLSFDTLLTMLVRIVLRDNLIDAVIDDGKGARPGGIATGTEREYEEGMNPVDDAELGMKP
jgi:hypothetical protein